MVETTLSVVAQWLNTTFATFDYSIFEFFGNVLHADWLTPIVSAYTHLGDSEFIIPLAVLGVVLLNIDNGYGFAESMINSLGAGIGFLVAMVMFSGVRERMESSDIPESLKGLPITLVAAALVSMSFLGFAGLVENLFGV